MQNSEQGHVTVVDYIWYLLNGDRSENQKREIIAKLVSLIEPDKLVTFAIDISSTKFPAQ